MTVINIITVSAIRLVQGHGRTGYRRGSADRCERRHHDTNRDRMT